MKKVPVRVSLEDFSHSALRERRGEGGSERRRAGRRKVVVDREERDKDRGGA